MRTLRLGLFLGLLLTGAASGTALAQAIAPPTSQTQWTTQYFNITEADADALLKTLESAQTRLRDGERMTFELLSGAVAFYSANRISPRDAFLGLSLERPFLVRKHPARDARGYRYEIAILPYGTGQLFWDIEVYLEPSGALGRVQMFQRPPHPF